jgi:hypothetical protein
LIQNENLFEVVILNYEDLKSKINYYRTEFSQNSSQDLNKVFVDINRLVLNLLSGFRTFLDHKETQIKRKFGKESNELLLFESEKKEAYENNFEYRFVNKLRNYSQHCGLPTLPPEIKSFQDSNNKVQHEFNVYFERANLLSRFDWGVKVREDLERQPEKFHFLPVLEKAYELLGSINKKINDRILENYKTEGNVLLNLIKKTVGFDGMPCLIKSEGSEIITFSINWFPLEHIAKITGAEIKIVYK